jgi:prefoldin subunit 5
VTTESDLFDAHRRGEAPPNPGDIAYELRLSRAEVDDLRAELATIARELVTIRQLVELLVAVAGIELVDELAGVGP